MSGEWREKCIKQWGDRVDWDTVNAELFTKYPALVKEEVFHQVYLRKSPRATPTVKDFLQIAADVARKESAGEIETFHTEPYVAVNIEGTIMHEGTGEEIMHLVTENDGIYPKSREEYSHSTPREYTRKDKEAMMRGLCLCHGAKQLAEHGLDVTDIENAPAIAKQAYHLWMDGELRSSSKFLS